MINLGKLVEIKDLREIWSNEATDFTPWLANEENIRLLSDTLGIEIEIEERESSVGSFNVDIYGQEVGTGKKIIIENQLEDTNHDHLGKLMTYAAGKSASIIVWLVKNAREEHRAAVEWLNNHLDDEIGIFLCEIKLYKIGDSKPAVKFEIVEQPNNWTKEQKRSDTYTNAEQFRMEFWTKFNDYAAKIKEFTRHFNPRKASTDLCTSYAMGSSSYNMPVDILYSNNIIGIHLNIHDDKDLYRKLFSYKEQIEKEIGFSMDWKELPDKKASRIGVEKKFKDLKNKDNWQEQFDYTIDTMVKMKKAFKKYI